MAQKAFFVDERELLAIEQEKQKQEKKKLSKSSRTSKKKIYNCSTCGLDKTCRSPDMQRYGKCRAGIMFVGIAPGAEEDKNDIPFVGPSGEFLRQTLVDLNIDLDEDCSRTNIVRCKLPKNRNPKRDEILSCQSKLIQDIEEVRPRLIITLGKEPTNVLFRYLGKGTPGLGLTHGLVFPIQKWKCWLSSTFHPAAILRERDGRHQKVVGRDKIFAFDIDDAIFYSEREFPKILSREGCILVPDSERCIEVLERMSQSKDPVSFDYECTCISAFDKDARLLTVGVSNDPEIGYCIPIGMNRWNEVEVAHVYLALRKFLASDAPKVVQNYNMEELWSRIHVGQGMNNLCCDTMVAHHVVYCRKKTADLDFQVGLLTGDDYKGMVNTKRMSEEPIEKIGIYNPLDSRYTLLSYRTNIKKMDSGLREFNDLLTRGVVTMANLKERGVRIDQRLLNTLKDNAQDEVKELSDSLMLCKACRKYEKETGSALNVRSGDQLAKLLFTIYGDKSIKTTSGGKPCTDAEVIEKLYAKTKKEEIRTFLKILIDLKKVQSFSDKIDNFRKHICSDGKIHPSFHLDVAETYRSCIAEGTNIEVVRDVNRYPKGIPIEHVKEGDYVYCYNSNLDVCIKKVLWAGKTGHKEIIRLHWESSRGTKGYLDVTPEHKVRLVDGTYLEAKYLNNRNVRSGKQNKHVPGVQVLSLGRMGDNVVQTGKHFGLLDHRLVYENVNNTILPKHMVIHHIDGNHYNNVPSNLIAKARSDHSLLHCTFNEESRKKALSNRRKNVELGLTKLGRTGEENGNWISFSKFSFLRLLAEHSGKVTSIDLEHGTIQSKAKLFSINLKNVKDRYTKEGYYISLGKLKGLYTKGHDYACHVLRVNPYKLRRLYEQRDLEWNTPRKWANQYGTFSVNNHKIVDVEILNTSVNVYDIEVEGEHNFIANEICVHNSSSDPNFQNVPKHDDLLKLIRECIIPSPGNVFLEVDYDGLEVRGIAMNSNDRTLINEIKGGDSSDTHRLWASKIFEVPFAKVDKEQRFLGKNKFVFPSFYGAQPFSIANSLKMEEAYIKGKWDEFWRLYKDVKKWQDNVRAFYEEYGYIRGLSGYRRFGPLSVEQLYNTPVQGISFHLALDALIRIDGMLIGKLRRQGLRAVPIVQVHDSILFDCPINEIQEVVGVVSEIMKSKRFEWQLDVPLSVSWEKGEDWLNMKKLVV
jgi:uracil-DNA glycosylase family 4